VSKGSTGAGLAGDEPQVKVEPPQGSEDVRPNDLRGCLPPLSAGEVPKWGQISAPADTKMEPPQAAAPVPNDRVP
jgi:hypothetical protein